MPILDPAPPVPPPYDGPRPDVNVAAVERAASAVAGGALVSGGLARRSAGGTLLAALGGWLLYRGATGHCPVYGALGLTTADDPEPETVGLVEEVAGPPSTSTVQPEPA